MKKIKTYVIMVSRTFPVYHPRKKEPTYFVEKIQLALNMLVQLPGDLLIDLEPKVHTFRGNYPLWKNRINEVLSGNAVIVLKYHSLGRYVKGNKQIEFARLDKDSGVGVTEFFFLKYMIYDSPITEDIALCDNQRNSFSLSNVAMNDGLTLSDFKYWFRSKQYNINNSFACIYFTPFRHGD